MSYCSISDFAKNKVGVSEFVILQLGVLGEFGANAKVERAPPPSSYGIARERTASGEEGSRDCREGGRRGHWVGHSDFNNGLIGKENEQFEF